MNIYAISAIGVVFVAAGVVIANSTGGVTGQVPTEFSGACTRSVNAAADWGVAEAERQGKDVSFFKRSMISFQVPSICGCAHGQLAAETEASKWPLAGELVGAQMKMQLAMHAKSNEVRQSARAVLQDELKTLMDNHQASLTEIGVMSRRIDTALKYCMRKQRA